MQLQMKKLICKGSMSKEQMKMVLVIIYYCLCARKWVYLYHVPIPK